MFPAPVLGETYRAHLNPHGFNVSASKLSAHFPKLCTGDIILLDVFEPQFFPSNNLISALVYSAKGSEVDTVFIGGRMVMEEKKILSMNVAKVFTECEKIAARLGMRNR